MRPVLRNRPGVVLFEVIVALSILIIAGLTAAVWVQETVLAVDHARHGATEVRAASDYLDLIALWPREDLDRHLGDRREGAWTVRVDRPTPTLYTVTVKDSTGARTLLRTAVYRAEGPHAGP